ncbi:Gfo/Idh/MocA family protein [Flavitalea flava]
MTNSINWGIIGCGNVTEIKSGPAFNKIPGSRLIAVMRRDAGKARDYAARHKVAKWYTDAEEMMNDPEINAIYIATPPAFHLPYAIAALKKGLHVYVEKPVTLNAGEAGKMADEVRQSQGKLSVAHYRRRLPLFLRIKELIGNGSIGEIRTVQIRLWQSRKPAFTGGEVSHSDHHSDRHSGADTNWRVQPELSGGGYFHDLAPHQLDLMLYYFGEPLKYHGFGLNQAKTTRADDHVCGQLVFKNGIVVNGSWCFNVGREEQADTCEIIGTEGHITFAFFGDYVSWKSYKSPNKEENKPEVREIFIHPSSIQEPMIGEVVAYFSGLQENPCGIDEASQLMDIMDVFSGAVSG